MIIGISGKRESGKSSLAKALGRYNFIRVSLASPLKEMCRREYGLTADQVYGVFKESPTQFKRTDGSFYTPRDILIREGCLKRSIDRDYWCRKLEQHMDLIEMSNLESIEDNFVIDDIRFLNEIEYFKRLGARFVRLERSEEAIGKAALDDLSECELDNYKDWDLKLEAKFNNVLADLDQFAEVIVAKLGALK